MDERGNDITHPKVVMKSHSSNVGMSQHKTQGLEAPDNERSHLYNDYVHSAFIFWESYSLQ